MWNFGSDAQWPKLVLDDDWRVERQGVDGTWTTCGQDRAVVLPWVPGWGVGIVRMTK